MVSQSLKNRVKLLNIDDMNNYLVYCSNIDCFCSFGMLHESKTLPKRFYKKDEQAINLADTV